MSETPVLKVFKYCPQCASSRISLKDGKCVVCPDCDFILYYNPTCSAGALIFDAQGRLLVIERANEPSKGKYGIPGGFTDQGERLEEVAIRETKEEVNLDLESIEFYASFPNTYRYRGVAYSVTDTYFKASVESFDQIAPDTGEVASIHFVDPAQVPDEKWGFESLRSVIAMYLKQKNARS